MQDGTRVSLLVDQRLNADGLPSERGTLKVPDDAGIGITSVRGVRGGQVFLTRVLYRPMWHLHLLSAHVSEAGLLGLH